MIEYEEALNMILKNAKRLPSEMVPIEESIGRVLDEDIFSQIEMPPFNKSAMDGYALRAEDIKNAPIALKCIGLIQAGDNFRKKIKKGQCVKIMTGAPLPDDTDSVVMVERTKSLGTKIEILERINKGKNVCMQGEDMKINQKVLKKGDCISRSDLAIIAAAGKKIIKVIKKPSVAILNTGGEIIPVGNPLPKNKIYNSNGPMLCSLLNSDNIPLHFLGIVEDNVNELKKAIQKGLRSNILLISGGVSMGDYDLVPGTLKKLGVKEKFHNIRVKPGRPLYFGTRNNRLVFGIPGNPISNFLAYYIFIRPAIYKMIGYDSYIPELKYGFIKSEYKQKTGRTHFVLAHISKKTGQYNIEPVKSHGSADISALSKANAFMVVDKEKSVLKKNSKVKFLSWEKI